MTVCLLRDPQPIHARTADPRAVATIERGTRRGKTVFEEAIERPVSAGVADLAVLARAKPIRRAGRGLPDSTYPRTGRGCRVKGGRRRSRSKAQDT